MTSLVPDIVESWINLTVGKSTGNTVVFDSGTNTSTFKTCDTLWVLQNGNITIDTVEYPVVSVIRNTSIVVTGDLSALTTFSFTVANPFFIHGTPRQTTSERTIMRKDGVKNLTPLAYLFEPINEAFNNELNPVQRNITIRLAILNNYKQEQFTDDIYSYSIEAMRNYSEKLIDVIKNDVKRVEKDEVTYRFTSYPKYGQFINRSGSTQNIFNENLSGVEINLTIPLKYELNCLNLCNN